MNLKLLTGFFVLLFIQIAFISCKQENKASESDILSALITNKGTLITDFLYYELYSSVDERVIANKIINEEKKWGIIDYKGNEILPFIYDFITDYQEGYTNILKDDKWGLADAQGNIVVPCIYTHIRGFKNNLLFVNIDSRREEVLDFKAKKTIISFDNDQYYTDYFNENILIVNKFNQYDFNYYSALMDLNTKQFITPFKYNSISKFYYKSERFLCAELDGKFGVFNKDGQGIISCIYDEIAVATSKYKPDVKDDEYYICVKKDNKWGIFDLEGNVIIDFKYDSFDLSIRAYPYCVAVYDGKYGVINSKDSIVIPFIYDNIRDFEDGIFIGYKNRRCGAFDLSNNEIIPFDYEHVYLSYMGNYPVQKDDKWGVINSDQKIIIPFVYESLSFENGILKAKKDGKWGIINLDNNETIPFSRNYTFIHRITNEILRVAIKRTD